MADEEQTQDATTETPTVDTSEQVVLDADDIDEVAPEQWTRVVYELETTPAELRVYGKHGGGDRYIAAKTLELVVEGGKWSGVITGPGQEQARFAPMLPEDFVSALYQSALVTAGSKRRPSTKQPYRDVVFKLYGIDDAGSECLDIRARCTLVPAAVRDDSAKGDEDESVEPAVADHCKGYVTVEYFTNFVVKRLEAFELHCLPSLRATKPDFARALREAKEDGRKEMMTHLVSKLEEDDDDDDKESSALKRAFMKKLPDMMEGFGRGIGDGIAEKGDKWLGKLFGED